MGDLTFTYPGSCPAGRGGDALRRRRGGVRVPRAERGRQVAPRRRSSSGCCPVTAGARRCGAGIPRSGGGGYYQRIGVSFELPNHYQKLTARENLEFFASLYEGPTEDPVALLEAVDLAEHADLRVGRFSKGMQMRLVFARALLHRPGAAVPGRADLRAGPGERPPGQEPHPGPAARAARCS